MDNINEFMEEYLKRCAEEKETLVAKFMTLMDVKASEIVLVEQRTKNGMIFYPDFKIKHELSNNYDSQLSSLNIAVKALNQINKDFGTDYSDGNTMIANTALEKINNLLKGDKNA